MRFCPAPHPVKIPALVYGVEVGVGLRRLSIPPHLPENSNVHRAHELLAQDIEAMCCSSLAVCSKFRACRAVGRPTDVEAQDVVRVLKCPLAKRVVVVEVVIQRLPEEILPF